MEDVMSGRPVAAAGPGGQAMPGSAVMITATYRNGNHMDALTTRKLLDAVCAIFDLGCPDEARLTLIGRGAVGRVWRLDAMGSSYAVKEFFWEVTAAKVSREVAFCAAAIAAGVAAPRPLPGAGGRHLCALSEEGGSKYARLYTWADGALIAPEAPPAGEGVGRLLGRLHSLRQGVTERPEAWYEVIPSLDRFAALAEQATAAGLRWGPMLERSLEVVEELAALVSPAPSDELIMAHLDVAPSNVVVDDGTLILLDWDNAGPGHPDRELALTLMHWHTLGDAVDEAKIARTMTEYRLHGGYGAIRSRGAFATFAATWLNFVEAQARLTLEAAHVEHASFSAKALARVLANPPTTATMDRVIRAASVV
jgi:Ser/Thr protein kinase RdoA (MazF antagonist)